MRRKVNNSEIHEIKKYYEVPSEKAQEWSDTIADLTKQLDEYKAECEMLKREKELLIKERDYYNGRYETIHANEVEARKDKNEFMKQKCLLEKEKSELQETINKQDHTIATLFDERENLKQELHSIYKENEYLLNVIKMSENIEIHSDAYDEMEKGENNKTHHIPHITNINIKDRAEEPMKFIKKIAKERADDER